ncbi:hypothetical protein ABT56_21950 [Photobacterium aquae]|uniref:Lipoprotein n=1 Tax=Photobacterium aquae TaxID=1195763 RepID=A0A0J1GPD7_9GAMM|nr:DUF2850 domain-containing protein [Photobacterium aquae]KLV01620.1 hypothetical protein ABT56_21950 [Photobacterium aquae]
MARQTKIRIQLAMALRGGLASLVVITFVIAAYSCSQPKTSGLARSDIYGVWVEQDVAPYAADSFELRPAGVFVGGRQVSTDYTWNGRELEYRYGNELYRYHLIDQQLIREQPVHYVSSFTRQAVVANHSLVVGAVAGG